VGDFQKEEKRMSTTIINILTVPTFTSLEFIALENAALARNLGLSDDKSVETQGGLGQKITTVIAGAINTNAFWGDNWPDYPSQWG
jgi:hypothetical protein